MTRGARTHSCDTATPEDALLAAIIRQAVLDYQTGTAPHDRTAARLLGALGLLDRCGQWTRRGQDWDTLVGAPARSRPAPPQDQLNTKKTAVS